MKNFKELLKEMNVGKSSLPKEFFDFYDKFQKDQKTKRSKQKPREKSKSVVTSSDWKNFENLLKKHDWTYQRSDDKKVYQKGKASKKQIDALYDMLKVVDKAKTEKLYRKYAKL